MNFDRREWLAIIAAGTAKLLGVPGKAIAELPDDDEESSLSMSNSGSQCGTQCCDNCGYHFSASAMQDRLCCNCRKWTHE